MDLLLGLVGRGRWGRNIERTLLSLSGVSVLPIARGDRPPVGLDGVLIATPSATHAEVALPYIEAGMPTFIEKPMATTVADAERLTRAAARSGAVVFVGHLYLYHPAFLAALELLPRLGGIDYVLGAGMNGHPRDDSSVLWDWLPHDLSMALAIFGCGPCEVATWRLDDAARPRAAVAKFCFGDTPVVASVSWLSSARCRATTIVGEKATLVFDSCAERPLTLYEKPSGEPICPEYDRELPLTREMRAFLAAVRSGVPPRSDGSMGAVVVRAIAAAERSIERGARPVVI